MTTKVLFVGESWQGSNARSLLEALRSCAGVVVQEIGEDLWVPRHRHWILRASNRALRRLQRSELDRETLRAVDVFRPHVLLVYKGSNVSKAQVDAVRARGTAAINVFPDYSPHAYGARLKSAVGSYDLVVSTKAFHPGLWHSIYGYQNACVFVPHGYDPLVHYWPGAEAVHRYDVALCATWRPEYHRLMTSLAEEFSGEEVRTAVAGAGWLDHPSDLPQGWHIADQAPGRSYGEFVRSARIVIAPVNREVTVDGRPQPGDEDSARTYELAAAHCFFLHQRTDLLPSLYDEHTEVPLWSSPRELADMIRRWLPDDAGRLETARRAHERAVPAYSLPSRAATVLEHVRHLIAQRSHTSRA